jgi:hypothetical protein
MSAVQLARTIDEGIDCPQCHCLFLPKRSHQRFCSTKCRAQFHTAKANRPSPGPRAVVSSVRVMRRGTVSVVVVVRFQLDERDAALKLQPGQLVAVVAE